LHQLRRQESLALARRAARTQWARARRLDDPAVLLLTGYMASERLVGF
jgi:hypothetical protein